MGKEATCRVRYSGKEWTGKAHLEEGLLTVRGEPRLAVPLRREARSDDGWLVVPGPEGEVRLELGAEAGKWANSIQNPKTLIDKLGLRADQSIVALGFSDLGWLGSLPCQTKVPTNGACDAILLHASSIDDLGVLESLKSALAPRGMLWIVFPKARAELTEMHVFAAGRAVGLVDVKVGRFSGVDTGLKFVRPKAS